MNTKLLRSKLLSLAIAGRLVPQDPNDEPAIALLRRINPKATPLASDDAPFPVPDSWCWCRLGDIAFYKKGPFGSSLTKSMFVPKSENTFKVYEQKNAIQKDENIGEYYITKDKYESLIGFAIHPYDIIVSCAGTIGESYILSASPKSGIINQALMLVRLYDRSIESFYMLYFDYILKKEANKKSKGTAIKNIPPFAVLKNLPFPLPPLAEQERIVKEVERWFACIEQLERSREALGKAARQTKRTLLSLAIAGRLVPQDPNDEPAAALLRRINPKFTPLPTDSPLPPGWTACTMSMLCELTDGERINGKEMINLDAKYLRGQNEGKTLKEGRTVPANSLLILVDGENSGEVFRTPIEGYQGSTFKRLVINDNMYESFVLHVINSHRKRLRENKVGSAIPHLNKKLFRELTVLVPPLAEQERIVGKAEELFAVLDRLSPSAN